MTSTRNKFLLALVALVLLATYAAAVKSDCSVENCATCIEGDATKCKECNADYELTTEGQCVAASDAAAAPHSGVAAVAALAAAVVAYAL
ncbi:hypothetical protein Q4I28_000393 [Leishmania naiffi]|uniref:Surface antigen-like protein n=1 Tax=Leishmania naiffi TaxID=5678 RepID=A0AAW3CCZ5_9TRYP